MSELRVVARYVAVTAVEILPVFETASPNVSRRAVGRASPVLIGVLARYPVVRQMARTSSRSS